MFGAPRTASRAIASAVSRAPVSAEPHLLARAAASGRGSTAAAVPADGLDALGRGLDRHGSDDSADRRAGALLYCSRHPCPACASRPLAAAPALPALPAAAHARRSDHAAVGRSRAACAAPATASSRAPTITSLRRRGRSTSSARRRPRDPRAGHRPGRRRRPASPRASRGSPVKCVDPADGVAKTIGAIAQGTGDYGNKLVLVTPIQTMLGEPVVPPVARRRAESSAAPRARPARWPRRWRSPASRGPVATVAGQGRRRSSAARSTPRPPRRAPPPSRPRRCSPAPRSPRRSPAGDIEAGAVGTVTYVDGDKVWAFGHPLDGAGRRSLLLQDAYVYTVVDNPLDTEESTSYKFAAPGHDLGTLTDDAPDGVVGRLGALPEHVPAARHRRPTSTAAASCTSRSRIADETAVGQPDRHLVADAGRAGRRRAGRLRHPARLARAARAARCACG